jgi:hypothetical protein
MRRDVLMRAWEAVAYSPRATAVGVAVIWVITTTLLWLAELNGFGGRTATVITFSVMVCLGAAAILILAWGTVRKNRWGINTGVVSCPRCHTQLPRVRKPESLQQVLWGGGTCPICGTEVDKWGRELKNPVSLDDIPKNHLNRAN